VRIRKAVITAAGKRQRSLPLQTLVDRDGEEKSVLGILVEHALEAAVEEVFVVVHPGDESRYSQAAGRHASRVRFLTQEQPLGYGHAIWCAREAVGDEAFLHLVGDHLPVNSGPVGCARRLTQLAEAEECAVSAVQVTRENLLQDFGALSGRRAPGRPGVYRVDTVIEKPTPTEAEQRLLTPGLRAGYYLCLYGMHVLTPLTMELLQEQIAANPQGPVLLSPALAELARRTQYLALEESDRRFDIGARYGLLMAQLSLALSGSERTEILARLVELLAARESSGGGGSQQ
jgi:UTP--glucose-1-phosphate uridylyltransferase